MGVWEIFNASAAPLYAENAMAMEYANVVCCAQKWCFMNGSLPGRFAECATPTPETEQHPFIT
jgi:hypothetical protein